MGWSRSGARSFYQRLLGLYPEDFRDEFGGEMEQLFADRARGESLGALLWETTLDTLRTAPKEHLSMLIQDIKYASRMMTKNPAFTAAAALSLALGIGANTAIFSLADALLLRPIAAPESSRIVTVRSAQQMSDFTSRGISYRDFTEYNGKNQSFEGLLAFDIAPFGLTTRQEDLPVMQMGMVVSGNFFDVLRVQPAMGRAFRPEEDQVPGRDAVAVISHDLWKSQFHSAPDVVGRKVRLNGIEFTVIGVTPEQFTGMHQLIRPAFYVPAHMFPALTPARANILEDRAIRAFEVKGRLKPGVAVEAAQADLQSIATGLSQQFPDTNKDEAIRIRTELQYRIEQSPPDAQLVALLMGLVAVVLLIACANVANLLLSRSRARSREIAVRLAIGAGRARLVRQLLTESLMLSLSGGVMGLAIAWLAMRFFERIRVPSDLPIVFSFRMDERVLLFSLLVSLFSAVIFGLVPALQSVRSDLVGPLKAGDTGASARGRLMGRNALVVAQVALSLVLLVSATMFYRGFQRYLSASPGFRTSGLVMMGFDPTLLRYSEPQTKNFYRTLIHRVRSTPGVKSAALAQVIPMGNEGDQRTLVPEGYQFQQGQTDVTVPANTVDEQYFNTMGVEVIRGRGFLASDHETAPKVAVINEEFARRYFPNQDPVGKRFRLVNAGQDWVRVVGLTRTGKYFWIAEPPVPFVYLPYSQFPRSRMRLFAESAGPSSQLIPTLREVVRSLDPNQPIYAVRTMEEFYDMRAVSVPNMIVQIVGAMGTMGLGLAMVGLYGLVAYSVSRRTREIGIRMAIGAGKADVLRMVLKQGLLLGGIGVAFGLVISVFVSRILASGMIGMGQVEPGVLLLLPLLLLAVTMFATYIPARRASLIDPTRALRWE
ncbi:MAG: ABC transporter permease [Bryobacteraceae bacterium]|nr:ABC transporter permease [Bryobacteraceae bacterium]